MRDVSAPAVSSSEDAPVGQASGENVAEATGTMLPSTQSITADEIALYDRQIRLWGVQAQEKIRTANILLIGLQGLGSEVAKNLVLAGIGTLTIVDDQTVTEDDLSAQFFISEEHVGQNRAQAALPQIQKLNPRVQLRITTMSILLQTPALFGAYTLIIVTDLPISIISTINAACRLQQKPFYAAATFGMYGFVFADLIKHTFIMTREKSNVPAKVGPESATRSIISVTSSKGSDGKETELVTKSENYSPIILANTSPLSPYHLSSRRRRFAVTPLLSCLRALWEYQSQTSLPFPSHSAADLKLFTTLATAKHKELQLPTETLRADILRAFLQNLGSEISPVCAFLGGQLAQDVINVIGGKEQPLQNFLVFDGEDTKGLIYALHTEMGLELGNGMDIASAGMKSMQNGPLIGVGPPAPGGIMMHMPV